ncbi:MAG: hypothetical protein R3F39_14220 [Myxococcota bacterium]
MAYQFEVTTGYGRLRRYASQVLGGVGARGALAGSGDDWRAMLGRIVAERASREAADDGVLMAGAVARVADVDFDASIGEVSGVSWLLAGKKPEGEPYLTLFGRIDAKRARGLGLAKASAVGERVVRDGRRLGVEGLAGALDGLDAATGALTAARTGVDTAEDALFEPRQAKKKLVRDLNQLIAVTEAAVLTAFPGRSDLVSAILTPWFERRRGAAASATAGEPGDAELEGPGDADDDGDEDLG